MRLWAGAMRRQGVWGEGGFGRPGWSTGFFTSASFTFASFTSGSFALGFSMGACAGGRRSFPYLTGFPRPASQPAVEALRRR